jgi:hypothetical protein
MCRRFAAYANKPHNAAKAWTFLRNAAFLRHAAPFHTTPRHIALVQRDVAFVPQLL